ncbi:MAG: allantoate amidohydrolase [Planctomycetota bacterium]
MRTALPSSLSPPNELDRLAHAVMGRCDAIAECTEEPGRITRRYLSAPMRTVHERIGGWMQAAGLATRVDHAGNLFGLRRGACSDRTLLVGSHLDTVPGGGRYDGVLGVLMGVALAESLGDARLPFDLEVVGFSEEEGVRYSKPYLGSAAVAGRFKPAWLARTDRAGVTVREAIAEFGGDADRLEEAAYDPQRVIGYVEPHLEQGPVLERAAAAVGVVSGIVGQSRLRLEFIGETAHAGTTPMIGRRDALAPAAAMVGETRRMAESTRGLLATVGKIDVSPNAPNVVADRVELALDVRHPSDASRDLAVDRLVERARELAAAERCECRVLENTPSPATIVDRQLSDRLADAVTATGVEPLRLPSGAGHDAVMMARRFPVAMLFIRHPGGVSHHPDERCDRDDVAVGVDTLRRLVLGLAEKPIVRDEPKNHADRETGAPRLEPGAA